MTTYELIAHICFPTTSRSSPPSTPSLRSTHPASPIGPNALGRRPCTERAREPGKSRRGLGAAEPGGGARVGKTFLPTARRLEGFVGFEVGGPGFGSSESAFFPHPLGGA